MKIKAEVYVKDRYNGIEKKVNIEITGREIGELAERKAEKEFGCEYANIQSLVLIPEFEI